MKDKILRIQADRLNKALGLKEGTYMARPLLEKIRDAELGSSINVDGNAVKISVSARAYAGLLLLKIDEQNQV